MLLAIQVITLENATIGPLFPSLSCLCVVKPSAYEYSTIVMMIVFSLAVIFIGLPLPFVNIAVLVDKPASSICLALTPESLVQRTIRPQVHTKALPKSSFLVPHANVKSCLLAPSLLGIVFFFDSDCLGTILKPT